MKARHKVLVEHSTNMMLAAIEIYNKPSFPAREQVFSVLAINAWEALAKSKILKDNSNKLNSLYIKEGRRYKRSKRTGTEMTIDFVYALDRCGIPEVVRKNLLHLYDVRNA